LRSPSWSNTQPYRIAAASDGRRDRISQELVQLFDSALSARDGGLLAKTRILLTRRGMSDGDLKVPLTYPPDLQPRWQAVGSALCEKLGIGRGDFPARSAQLLRNFDFCGAPTVIFIFVHSGLREFFIIDAGVMLQTLTLSATARGLGTCAQGALANSAGPVRRGFQVPVNSRLLCEWSIGYPSGHPVNRLETKRASLDEILLRPIVDSKNESHTG